MKLLLALALVPALVSATPAPDNRIFDDAVAVAAAPAPFLCGMLMSYGSIDFTHKGETVRVYALCANAEDLPRTGARCAITFHAGKIGQLTPDSRRTPFVGNILDKMRCNPPAEAAHHDYRGATITGYGHLPVKDGGIGVHPRSVQVRTAEGETRDLYFVHGYWADNGVPMAFVGTERRAYPAIGTRCDFSTSASIRYRSAIRDPGPVELIYQINC